MLFRSSIVPLLAYFAFGCGIIRARGFGASGPSSNRATPEKEASAEPSSKDATVSPAHAAYRKDLDAKYREYRAKVDAIESKLRPQLAALTDKSANFYESLPKLLALVEPTRAEMKEAGLEKTAYAHVGPLFAIANAIVQLHKDHGVQFHLTEVLYANQLSSDKLKYLARPLQADDVEQEFFIANLEYPGSSYRRATTYEFVAGRQVYSATQAGSLMSRWRDIAKQSDELYSGRSRVEIRPFECKKVDALKEIKTPTSASDKEHFRVTAWQTDGSSVKAKIERHAHDANESSCHATGTYYRNGERFNNTACDQIKVDHVYDVTFAEGPPGVVVGDEIEFVGEVMSADKKVTNKGVACDATLNGKLIQKVIHRGKPAMSF